MNQRKDSFDQMLRTQAARALPELERLDKSGVRYILRRSLADDTGLNDNELQKLIHDGNLPRHSLRVNGEKAYEVDSSLKLLARFCHRYEYLVD